MGLNDIFSWGSMPVVSVGEAGFARLLEHRGRVSVADALVALGDDAPVALTTPGASPPRHPDPR